MFGIFCCSAKMGISKVSLYLASTDLESLDKELFASCSWMWAKTVGSGEIWLVDVSSAAQKTQESDKTVFFCPCPSWQTTFAADVHLMQHCLLYPPPFTFFFFLFLGSWPDTHQNIFVLDKKSCFIWHVKVVYTKELTKILIKLTHWQTGTLALYLSLFNFI